MRKIVVGLFAFVCCFIAADLGHAQDNEKRSFRKRNAFIGIGLGVSSYSLDTSSLNTAFNAIEDFYRDQGWSINSHSDFSPAPLITYSVRFQFASPVGLVLDAAQNTNKDKISALSATLLIDFPRLGSSRIRPYIGAGITDVSFDFERPYGNRIGPTDSGGGYPTLESIRASGSETGGSVVGGFQIVSVNFRLLANVTYWKIPKISDSFGTPVTTTVDLSSVNFGLQLMVTLP